MTKKEEKGENIVKGTKDKLARSPGENGGK
jgi:hypothetical protein